MKQRELTLHMSCHKSALPSSALGIIPRPCTVVWPPAPFAGASPAACRAAPMPRILCSPQGGWPEHSGRCLPPRHSKQGETRKLQNHLGSAPALTKPHCNTEHLAHLWYSAHGKLPASGWQDELTLFIWVKIPLVFKVQNWFKVLLEWELTWREFPVGFIYSIKEQTQLRDFPGEK